MQQHISMDEQYVKYMRQNRRYSIWKRIVGSLACLVVFCTTYLLILPAITLEQDTFCGYEAHTHSEECYVSELVCENEESEGHSHSEDCYLPAHTHTEDCYTPEEILICELETSEGHAHDANCYITENPVICEIEESPGHAHGEDCYITEAPLACTAEETPGHTHGDGCYAETVPVLTCEENGEEHIHIDDCYTLQGGELTCSQTETEGHAHGEGCYGEAVTSCVCTLTETEGHTHSESCYGEAVESLACTLTETEGHAHDENCYAIGEDVLSCGMEERAEAETICELEESEGHTHTDECYAVPEEADSALICELDEHTHELICYADATADVETAADWEKTLANVELTGVWREDVLAIARSQMGYSESTKNYIVHEDGKTTLGYTRYGEWYGYPYGDWCAMFVSFCLDYAGVEGMPMDCGCQRWIETLSAEEYGLYRPAGSYEPQPGDLIFFDWEENGFSDHVGIVAELVEAADQEPVKIKTIEGNYGDCVQYVTYKLDDPDIMGYAVIPDAQGKVETMLTASIYTDGTYQQPAEDDTVITVSGVLPMGAEVRAFPVEIQQHDLDALYVYDIAIFLSDGSVYQHEGDPLVVNFSSPKLDELCSGLVEPDVFFIPEEGDPEPMDTVVEDGSVSFETPHFSTYALVVRADAIEVDTQDKLVAAWNAAVTAGGGTIQLTGSFEVNVTLEQENNVEIILDLNGHTLIHTGSASLFSVQAGTLTIGDSAEVTETVTKVADVTVGSLGAHVAAATETNGKVTLEYYVTESDLIEGTATGDTTETLYRHTVTGAGTVLAKASGQPLFTVTGGTLNIDSGMYYGGNGRAIYQTGGSTNLNGGYICGFAMNTTQDPNVNSYNTVKQEFGGAVWVSGGTELNLAGTVLAGNQAASGGAIYVENSTIEITDGIISGNVSTMTGNNTANNEGLAHYGGGGIFALRGTTITMSGGYITNNKAMSVGYFDGGGGVLLGGSGSESTMEVSDGYLTGNEAASGGAIRTNWANGARVTITGGYFCANYARSAEGGAVSINMDAEGIITGGFFNNNRTDNKTHWGGGAIFGANGGNLYMLNVLVTDNSAGGFGGGVAGCSTGRVQILVEQGGAVYDNSAEGQNTSGDGTAKNEDRVYAYNDPVFMSNGYEDFFCALNSTVEGSMLGGFSANWKGSSDGKPIVVPAEALLQSAYVAGLTSNPTDEGIQAAQKLAKVFINGNYSNTHGGGILANGYLLIGDTKTVTLSSRIELNGSKALVDDSGKYLTTDVGMFQFVITDAYTGEVIANGTNEADGTITFDRRLAYNAPGTYTYLIREVPQDNVAITYDTTVYRMTVTVETVTDTFYNGITDANDITRYWHQLTRVVIEKKVGDGWEEISNYDPGNSESGAVKVNLTGSATFTNLLLEYTDVTAVKKWEGEIPNTSVTVNLYRNGMLHDTQILNASNNWRYTWANLPIYEKDEEGEILDKYSYSVMEEPVEGYYSDYEITNDIQLEEYWIPAHYVSDSLQVGERYIVTYRDSAGVNQVLNIVAEENKWLTSADKVAAQWGDSSITYNGEQITAYFPNSAISERSIFRAMEEDDTHDHREGIKLYNMGAANALLIEKSGDNYLKVPSYWGRDNGWVSLFTYDGTKLYGHYQGTLDGTYTIIYEEASGKFDADPNDELQNGIAQLYTLVTAGSAGETVVTITNRPVEQLTYELNITKVSGWDPNVKLAGAVFNLVDAEGNVLKFQKEAEGSYVRSTTDEATDRLVTNSGGKLVLKNLPAGEYTLKEIEAPTGYLLAGDTPVTLGGEEQLSVSITVEDAPVGAYELPETGGTGTYLYTAVGFLLVLCGAALLLYKMKKRGREAF